MSLGERKSLVPLVVMRSPILTDVNTNCECSVIKKCLDSGLEVFRDADFDVVLRNPLSHFVGCVGALCDSKLVRYDSLGFISTEFFETLADVLAVHVPSSFRVVS